MRLVLALASVIALAACHPPKKQDPYAPRPDDVPQELTCCVTPAANPGDNPAYETVPKDRCPEEHQNPVDTCDIGPGDLPSK